MSGERLDAVASTTDGFELSRIDLAQRREGDILGAAQSGSKSTLRFSAGAADAEIIERAREDARSVVEKDPTLAKHPSLARTIDRALTLTVRRSSAGDKRPTGAERPARPLINLPCPPLAETVTSTHRTS